MKKLRDFLIVLVLGSVVVGALVKFASSVHQASVGMSPVVGQADIACIEDGMLCHVGYETWQSEADAQAYLDSSEHLKKVKEREERKAIQDQLEKSFQKPGATKK